MCTQPIEINGQKTRCRKCNACISQRKNTWVARAMAEKAVADHTFIINLTYKNLPNGEKPIGARAFRYKDVQNMFKRIRDRYKTKYGKQGEISYLVAGEQGSNGTQRVHWHIIIFSKRPLHELGKWTRRGEPIEKILMDQRINWDLWPHGLVFCQKPDQGGMAYVLKYALKDQFNVINSEGTSRIIKSENYGASMFRVSKEPPIGQRYLEQLVKQWRTQKVVPTNLKIKIPEYSGYWYPENQQREYLLFALHAINAETYFATGKDCPQFRTLLRNLEVEKNELDVERLIYGEFEEETEQEQKTSQAVDKSTGTAFFTRQQRTRTVAEKNSDIVRNCCGIRACSTCEKTLTFEARNELRGDHRKAFAQYKKYESWRQQSETAFESWWREKCIPSRGCGRAEIKETKDACRQHKTRNALDRQRQARKKRETKDKTLSSTEPKRSP